MLDLTVDIISYEMGELDNIETVELFSRLIQTGMIRHLQGSYQRQARDLIECGCLSETGEILDNDFE